MKIANKVQILYVGVFCPADYPNLSNANIVEINNWGRETFKLIGFIPALRPSKVFVDPDDKYEIHHTLPMVTMVLDSITSHSH